MIFLSPESLDLLKHLNTGLTIKFGSNENDNCISQLLEHGFIETHITDYSMSGESVIPRFSDYVITETGKAYLVEYEHEILALESLKSMAASAEEQAKSAKVQAELAIKAAEDAKKDSKIARREALFSKIIAILALIVAFLNPFLSTYATAIVEWLSELF